MKRAHQLKQRSGSGLVVKQYQKAKALGVVIEQCTKLERLIIDSQGRVLGAEVRRGYKFPDDASGSIAFIRATKGVVLASGGFSQGVALRQMYDPRLTDAFTSTNQPGATGEALMAASMIGALATQMDWIQFGPWSSQDEQGFGYIPQFVERVVGYGLMVDPANGKRFFKETGNRKERADAIIQLGHPALIIADKTNTLEEVAQAYGMQAAAFVEQVKRWNGYVEQHQENDPYLGCIANRLKNDYNQCPDMWQKNTANYYQNNVAWLYDFQRCFAQYHAALLCGAPLAARSPHHGGLAINKDAQVIGFDLKPIVGLYAAGEAAGGVHGAVRLGSVAMTDCTVFGRIAGKNVVKAS
ncbi:FAD-binding protein [Symbiopectobacterium sp. RP]|uniref:FAD-binding protein n=1 Tax=Symbiopectobacterium sp. RP TaxID=3248553 RepID=UPI003D26BEEF